MPWHLGVYLGAFDAFDLEGTVKLRIHGIDSVDLELRWTVPA